MNLEEQDYVALIKILLRQARKVIEKKYPEEDWDHGQLLDNVVQGAYEELREEDEIESELQKEFKK
jgi:hypothetical protein